MLFLLIVGSLSGDNCYISSIPGKSLSDNFLAICGSLDNLMDARDSGIPCSFWVACCKITWVLQLFDSGRPLQVNLDYIIA